MRNGSLEKEVFHYNSWIWFRDLTIIRIWGPEILHLKAHNFVWQRCFFFQYYLATSMIIWVQTVTGLSCMMLRYTKREDWYLTIIIITKGFQCFLTIIQTLWLSWEQKLHPNVSTNSWWLRGAMKRDSPVYWMPTHYVVYSLVLDHCPNTFRYGLFVAKVCWKDV